MKKKLPYAVLAATVAIPALAAPTPGFAATADQAQSGLYFSKADEQGVYYTFEAWSNLTATEKGQLLAKYGTSNVQVYLKAQSFEKITTLAGIADAGKPFNEAAVDYKEGDIAGNFKNVATGEDLVIAPVVDELTVESVMAINGTTIAAGTATDLKFLVNGKEELTKAEFEEKYEGYTVTFKYNKTGLSADGKVNVAAGTFKYAVQVTDAEGNLVPEELTPVDYVEVKAVAADKAVTVNEIGLVDAAGKAWTQSVLDGKVSIAPTKYVNALGQDQDAKNASEVEIVTAPTIKSVKSSDVTVAFWDATNEVIKVLNDGSVTFTVEFDGIEAKSTITFAVKADQEIGSVVTEDAKVAAGSDATVEFKVLDQDGETYLGSEDLYYTIKQAEGDDVQGTVSSSDGKASITKSFVKGDNTITIFADSDRKEKLGTIKVTAVDVTTALPDAYTLTFANKDVTSLDLNEDKNASTLEIDVKAFIDGIQVAANKGIVEDVYELEAKSANKNAPVETVLNVETGKLTVSLPEEGAKAGSATVDLYTVEGDLKVKVATISVEVKNTTPKFTALTLKKDTKVNASAEDLKAAVIEAVVEGELEEGALVAKHIASVTPVEGNGVVIVKIADLYGGALITLAANFEAPEVDPEDPKDPEVDPEDPQVQTLTFTSQEAITLEGVEPVEVKINGEVVGTIATDKEVNDTYVITFAADAEVPAEAFELVIGDTTYTITPEEEEGVTTWTAVEKKEDTPE